MKTQTQILKQILEKSKEIIVLYDELTEENRTIIAEHFGDERYGNNIYYLSDETELLINKKVIR